jgi:Ca2+-binding RTX toxin-like protein
LAAGALSAGQFLANATGLAGDANDHIIYNTTTTGGLFYNADGINGVAAIRFAGLSNSPALSNADFGII